MQIPRSKKSFEEISAEEINYYIENFKPFDKAGGYGIQEWIGYIKIARIEGSYANVVGLPTHVVYKVFSEIETLFWFWYDFSSFFGKITQSDGFLVSRNLFCNDN